MCSLQNALFSGPHQDLLINDFANYVHTIDPAKCQTAVFDTRRGLPQPQPEKDKIAGFFQQVAKYGNAPSKTFAVLAAMYIVPAILQAVQAATPVTIAKCFLDGFSDRFEQHLCGSDKRSNKLPLEIVLAEWQLYTKLATQRQ